MAKDYFFYCRAYLLNLCVLLKLRASLTSALKHPFIHESLRPLYMTAFLTCTNSIVMPYLTHFILLKYTCELKKLREHYAD